MEQVLVDLPTPQDSPGERSDRSEIQLDSPSEWKELLSYWGTTQAFSYSPKTMERIWDYFKSEHPGMTVQELKGEIRKVEHRLGIRMAEQPWIHMNQWVTAKRDQRAINEQLSSLENEHAS